MTNEFIITWMYYVITINPSKEFSLLSNCYRYPILNKRIVVLIIQVQMVTITDHIRAIVFECWVRI